MPLFQVPIAAKKDTFVQIVRITNQRMYGKVNAEEKTMGV